MGKQTMGQNEIAKEKKDLTQVLVKKTNLRIKRGLTLKNQVLKIRKNFIKKINLKNLVLKIKRKNLVLQIIQIILIKNPLMTRLLTQTKNYSYSHNFVAHLFMR